MTILGAELALENARLCIEENLETRVRAVEAVANDDLETVLPRVGVSPDGDYYEWDAGDRTIAQYPALTLHVRAINPAPDIDQASMSQVHSLEVTAWDEAKDQRVDHLVRRLGRLEAAIKTLLIYTKPRLETVLTPAGVASGVRWRGSRHDNITDVRRFVVLTFDVWIHEAV